MTKPIYAFYVHNDNYVSDSDINDYLCKVLGYSRNCNLVESVEQYNSYCTDYLVKLNIPLKQNEEDLLFEYISKELGAYYVGGVND